MKQPSTSTSCPITPSKSSTRRAALIGTWYVHGASHGALHGASHGVSHGALHGASHGVSYGASHAWCTHGGVGRHQHVVLRVDLAQDAPQRTIVRELKRTARRGAPLAQHTPHTPHTLPYAHNAHNAPRARGAAFVTRPYPRRWLTAAASVCPSEAGCNGHTWQKRAGAPARHVAWGVARGDTCAQGAPRGMGLGTVLGT